MVAHLYIELVELARVPWQVSVVVWSTTDLRRLSFRDSVGLLAFCGCRQGFCGTLLRRLQPTGFFFPGRKDKRLKFIVRHTIADIEYTCQGMLEKNKDFLRKDMMDVINASPDPVTSQLFAGVEIEAGKIGKGTLIASQFLKNLEKMIDIIGVRDRGWGSPRAV